MTLLLGKREIVLLRISRLKGDRRKANRLMELKVLFLGVKWRMILIARLLLIYISDLIASHILTLPTNSSGMLA